MYFKMGVFDVKLKTTATCLLSWKLFKLDEPDMQDTAGEAETNS